MGDMEHGAQRLCHDVGDADAGGDGAAAQIAGNHHAASGLEIGRLLAGGHKYLLMSSMALRPYISVMGLAFKDT